MDVIAAVVAGGKRMTIKELRKLQLKASKGNKGAQRALISATDTLTAQVNKNLRQLEKYGYDYGAYNDITNFTQIEYETNRLRKSKDLEYDWYAMSLQSQLAIKFLSNESSTLAGQREIQARRIATFKDIGVLPENITIRKARNFLKFLGNEESQQIIEAYGNSETVLEMMYDAYKKPDNSKNKMLSAFNEFLNGEKDFDEMMRGLKIKIEDY